MSKSVIISVFMISVMERNCEALLQIVFDEFDEQIVFRLEIFRVAHGSLLRSSRIHTPTRRVCGELQILSKKFGLPIFSSADCS